MLPYSSTTTKAAVLESTPDRVSLIVPVTVTGTILPLGGQIDEGFAATLTAGDMRTKQLAQMFEIAADLNPCREM